MGSNGEITQNGGNARVTVTKRQLSGEVSDEIAVSVGRQLGTQIIITGSIILLGTQMYTIQPENVLLSLLNSPDQNNDEIAVETQTQVHT